MSYIKCGDSFKLLDEIPDHSIDLVVTDPPYQFGSTGGGFYAKDNSTQRTYAEELDKLNCCKFEPTEFLDAIHTKLKKMYGYFFCNKTLVVPYIQWAIQHRYNYDLLVMAKSNPIPSFNNHHLPDLEYVVLIRAPGTYFSKHKDLDDFRKFYVTNCSKGIHPAEKPLDLIERFIRVSSKPGDTILDGFMGSGTTCVAAKNLNRAYIGFEIDPKYFEIAKVRLGDSMTTESTPTDSLVHSNASHRATTFVQNRLF